MNKMVSALEKFKHRVIRARTIKYVKNYFDKIELKKRLEENDNSEEFINNLDPILFGQWINPNATPEEIKFFKNELLEEILPIINALLRSSVEKYCNEKNTTPQDLENSYRDLFSNYKMKYDLDLDHVENPLNINRELRNEFLHGDKKTEILRTLKNQEKILFQRVVIKLDIWYFIDRDEKQLDLTNYEKKIIELNFQEKIKSIIKDEDEFGFYNGVELYFCELLVWRVKNLLEEIELQSEKE
ncbi:MAG: hypothetical protein HeimC3_53240 [Candidatus Heimdallarchaeota archaeon LC_3]|nr:MAG: hypothetical protein HeimC3_53240 [Candidatus Heimdallarchaeota archaeon LC_3]